MFQVEGGLPLPTSWEKFLPIFALGTGGKKYVFDFHSVALSTPKEVILVLAIYLSTLAVLKVRAVRGDLAKGAKEDGTDTNFVETRDNLNLGLHPSTGVKASRRWA